MLAILRKRAAGLSLLFLIGAVGLPAAHLVRHVLQSEPAVCTVGEGLYRSPDCRHLPDPCRLYASLRSLPAVTPTFPELWTQWEELPVARARAVRSTPSFAHASRAPPVLC
ncbi:hypothetical protein [Rhodothermus marinus]|uniref:hypothetical protein n=1 Tax=Rhodothermus marinus TaxID=29549 RepID=UPI000AD17206|nr:hypothetical protein [Rhodothermus marinus]